MSHLDNYVYECCILNASLGSSFHSWNIPHINTHISPNSKPSAYFTTIRHTVMLSFCTFILFYPYYSQHIRSHLVNSLLHTNSVIHMWITSKSQKHTNTHLQFCIHLTPLIHHPFHWRWLGKKQRHLLWPSFPGRVRLQHPLKKKKAQIFVVTGYDWVLVYCQCFSTAT